MVSFMEDRIEDRHYCIYVHISPSGKMYIGQTKTALKHRWRDGAGYLYKYKDRDEYKQPAFARAILKYGWDNFEHEVIASNLTKEEADNFEKLLIEKLDTMNPKYGYNCNSGGSNGSPSKETRNKISKAFKGENHPLYGKHHSEETKKKISESHKAIGRKVVQYDLKGNFIKIWDCMVDAGSELGVNKSAIWRCCNGKSKTSCGFIWKYYEDTEMEI